MHIRRVTLFVVCTCINARSSGVFLEKTQQSNRKDEDNNNIILSKHHLIGLQRHRFSVVAVAQEKLSDADDDASVAQGYQCSHFYTGEAGKHLLNAAGDKISSTMTLINTKGKCEKLCNVYEKCASYSWQEEIEVDQCQLFTTTVKGADDGKRMWCQKQGNVAPSLTEDVFKCEDKKKGDDATELLSMDKKKLSTLGKIQSETLCSAICGDRPTCKSYDWVDTGDEGDKCHLFTTPVAGGTHVTRHFCHKVSIHRTAKNNHPLFTTTMLKGESKNTENDVTGEVGFAFQPRHNLKLSALARAVVGTNVTENIAVSLWSVDTKSKVAQAVIGPNKTQYKDAYAYVVLTEAVVLQKGKQYRLTQTVRAGMNDTWNDIVGTKESVRAVMNTEMARFLTAVAGSKTGTYPDKEEEKWRRAGMLNFEAEIMDSQAYSCNHFSFGNAAEPVKTDLGEKVTAVEPVDTLTRCKSVCSEYGESCLAYTWDSEAKVGDKCTLSKTKEGGVKDHASAMWCKKIETVVTPATKLTWDCQDQKRGDATNELKADTGKASLTAFITSTLLADKDMCSTVCTERQKCRAYNWIQASGKCLLYSIHRPKTLVDDTSVTSYCAKVETPVNSLSAAPIEPFFTAQWPGTRNNLAAEIGYAFTASKDLKLLSLGRPQDVTTAVRVTLWAASTKSSIASVDVGPDGIKKDGYAYTTLADPVEIVKGKEYRITQTCTEGMADKWPDKTLSKEAITPFTRGSIGTFIGGVTGTAAGKYPAEENDDWQRAGMFNFEAQAREPSSFHCLHFTAGLPTAVLRNAAGSKISTAEKIKKKVDCAKTCQQYAACQSYHWSEALENDHACELFSNAEPGEDAVATRWCKKVRPSDGKLDKFGFQCHDFMHGEPLSELITTNGTKITDFGTIDSEDICSSVCETRAGCLSYDWGPMDEEKEDSALSCHLFAIPHPGGLKTTRKWCSKIKLPSHSEGLKPYFANTNFTVGTYRNDLAGEVGFGFIPKHDLEITMLGRPSNATTSVPVSIWDVETKKTLIELKVGPAEEGVTKVNGFLFVRLPEPVLVAAGKEVRFSQQCTKDMTDTWFDGTPDEYLVAENSNENLGSFTEAVFNPEPGFPATVEDKWRRAGMLNFQGMIVNATLWRSLKSSHISTAAIRQSEGELLEDIRNRTAVVTSRLRDAEVRYKHLETVIGQVEIRLAQDGKEAGPLKDAVLGLAVGPAKQATNETAGIIAKVDETFTGYPTNMAERIKDFVERIEVVAPGLGVSDFKGNIQEAVAKVNTTLAKNIFTLSEFDVSVSKLEKQLEGNFTAFVDDQIAKETNRLLMKMVGKWGDILERNTTKFVAHGDKITAARARKEKEIKAISAERW